MFRFVNKYNIKIDTSLFIIQLGNTSQYDLLYPNVCFFSKNNSKANRSSKLISLLSYKNLKNLWLSYLDLIWDI